MKVKVLNSINVNHFLAIAFVSLIIERFQSIYLASLSFDVRGLIYGLIAGLYTVRYTWKNNNDLKATLKLIVINLWCMFHILAINQPPFFKIERFVFVVFGSIWLTYEIMERILKIKPFLSNKVLFTGALLLVIEVIFRLSRWLFGNLIKLIAYLTIAVGFLIEARKWNNTKYQS